MNNGSRLAFELLGNLRWLIRYPGWRVRELIRRATENVSNPHLIIVVANHFEPAYNEEQNESGSSGVPLSEDAQLVRLENWCDMARTIGREIRDHDGTPFRHTNFYPAEQYYKSILDQLANLQAEGFGEVEIHLHHGVQKPDTSDNFRRVLTTFRDALVQEHRCLSVPVSGGPPMYAFVHGNWALANSADNRFCGVDDEMQILRDTGCYADLTLPSAPDRSQIPRLNAIYQCGGPLDRRMPHYSGPNLKIGQRPQLPIILTGPLVFDWRRRASGLPLPRLESGALTARNEVNIRRLQLWRNARISVSGRPEWVFAKLYCHGFFPEDQQAVIGSDLHRSLERLMEYSEQTGSFKVHFATSREAFNIAMAAVDGLDGEPGQYRDYYLRPIMTAEKTLSTSSIGPSVLAENQVRFEGNGTKRNVPKRVLYLTDLQPSDKFGSLEEQIFVLAKELQKCGGALIPVFGAPIDENTAAQYREFGVVPESLNLHEIRFGSLKRLLQLVRDHRVEIVHWNFYNPINPYVFALSLLAPRLKHYVTDHNSRIPNQENTIGPFKKRVKRFLLRRYDRVLCISDFVKTQLGQQDVWPSLSRCVYFINTGRFRPDSNARAEYRSKLGLSDDVFLILFVGKLIDWKGVDVAIKALSHLPESAVLLVAGEGERLGAMKELTARLHLDHRVHFLGHQRNVEPYMQAADCFLCPSLWHEAVGLVNIEALASGLPVVASNIGGIPEFVEDGVTGLLFSPGNEQELAERLQYLIKNPDVVRKMGEAARAAVVEKFSVEKRVPDYIELYTSK